MDTRGKFRGGGTWHRYKLGQAQFTKWLKQTADKVTPSPADGSNGGGSSRSAKNAQKKAASAGIDDAVAVHWRELETMAANIADNANPADIPSAPINILRDVIGLRKKSARFFRRNAESEMRSVELRAKNATHEHIIQVLERVLAKFEALRARVPSMASARDMERSGSGVEDLNNLFELLEVHGTTDADGDESASDVENQPETRKASSKAKKSGRKVFQKKNKQKKRKTGTLTTGAPAAEDDDGWIDAVDFGVEEQEDEEFDYYMMIYCFFEDFNLIRSYICERWCDYYFDRSISLDTLAVITNASFELFHQMEHDLLLDMRRIGIRARNLGHYETMMMTVFTESGMEHIEYESYHELSQKDQDEKMWKDEWDWLASPAYTAIQQALRFIPPGKTPMIRKSDRTPSDYGATTPKELNTFKETVIHDLLFDVVCIKALKKTGGAKDLLPAESELLLGFQDALRNYDYSSAFIFSLQLYVDIRYILEDAVTHPFEQLQRTAKHIERGLPGQIQQAAGPRSQMRRSLRQRETELQRFMLSDIVLDDKYPRYRNAGLTDDDVEEFYLLKHEPVWAGLLDFRAKLFMSELGHEYIHRSFVVEAGAYLYAAARAASKRFMDHQDFPVWTDMEKFLASYTDDSPLKRGILDGRDDPVAILRNIKAIMPLNVTSPKPLDIALDAVQGQTDQFKQAVRIRKYLSERYTNDDRTGVFFMQYMQGLIRIRLEPEMSRLESEDVSAVLRDISINKPSPLPHLKGALSEDQKALAAQRIGLREKQRAAKCKAVLSQLSPVQQIQILEDTVAVQLDGLLSIDFMNLFELAFAMLMAVCVAHPDSFKGQVGFNSAPVSTFPDRLTKVPLLVGDMLTGDAAKDEEILGNVARDVKAVLNGKANEMFEAMMNDMNQGP